MKAIKKFILVELPSILAIAIVVFVIVNGNIDFKNQRILKNEIIGAKPHLIESYKDISFEEGGVIVLKNGESYKIPYMNNLFIHTLKKDVEVFLKNGNIMFYGERSIYTLSNGNLNSIKIISP